MGKSKTLATSISKLKACCQKPEQPHQPSPCIFFECTKKLWQHTTPPLNTRNRNRASQPKLPLCITRHINLPTLPTLRSSSLATLQERRILTISLPHQIDKNERKSNTTMILPQVCRSSMEANNTARRAHHERGLDLAMAMSSLPSLTTYKEGQARAAQESHAHAPAPDVEEADEEEAAMPKLSSRSQPRSRVSPETPINPLKSTSPKFVSVAPTVAEN